MALDFYLESGYKNGALYSLSLFLFFYFLFFLSYKLFNNMIKTINKFKN